MPVKIVAPFNYKGGVAKTTSVINIGAKLAMDGRRVGLVDIDTQCNLSSFYLPEPMQAAENPAEDDDVELEQEELQGEDADSPGIAQVMLCCSITCAMQGRFLILSHGFPGASHHLCIC